jgi:hypothetical protein
MTGNRNKLNGDLEYLLETLADGQVSDMPVDLLTMSRRIYLLMMTTKAVTAAGAAAVAESTIDENE